MTEIFAERMLDSSSNSSSDGASSSPLWYVGVLLYSFGAFSMALGVVLQKYSINREMKKNKDVERTLRRQRPKVKQPIWIFGIIMYGSSGGLLSAALAFAPQSLLTPLMSVVIVSNALLARFLLLEPLTRRDFICICVIVIAVIATTASAPAEESEKNTEELIELYQESLFIIFLIVLIFTMTFFYVVYRVILAKKRDHIPLSSREDFLFSFSFGASAGCWGGLCVTMIKSALTIIEDKASNGGIVKILTEPLVYFLILILVTCWYMQLNWINKGLERYPAVFIVSIEAVLNEVVAVLGGMLYFKEYELFNAVRGVGFAFGLSLGVIGIIAFALRDNDVGPEQDFFSNSKHFDCCKCCNLPLGIGLEGGVKVRTVKSVMNNGEIIYIDDNGHEVEPGSNDHFTYENVQSPITLAVDSAVGAMKSVYEKFSYAEGSHADGEPRRRASILSRASTMISGGNRPSRRSNRRSKRRSQKKDAVKHYMSTAVSQAEDDLEPEYEEVKRRPNKPKKSDKDPKMDPSL